MMEVKHNTPVDFNDLMTSNGDVRSNNMHDIADLAAGSKLKTDLLNSNEISRNGVLSGVTNGSNSFGNAAETIDLDSDIDLGDPVPSELEEALLAEDGANVVDKLLAEVVPKAANIFESKTEVLSSVGCSDRVRDAGDDLDTLLSKINDLEDCIETARDASSKEELAHDTGKGAAAASTIEQTAEASTVCEDASTNSTCATLEEFEKEHVTAHKVIEECKDSEATDGAEFVDPEHALDSDKELINEEAQITAGCTETVVSNAVETVAVGAVTQGSSVSDDAAENADINNSVVTNETSTPDEIDKTTSSPAEIESKEQKAMDETTQDMQIPTLTLDDDDDDDEIMPIVEAKEAKNETKALNSIDSSDDAKKDSTSSTNLVADDSDDDIIFVADKPKCSKEETSGAEEKERIASEPAASSAEETKQNAAAVQEDDDVVLLDDDDEDDVIEQKERTPEKSDSTHEKKNVDELSEKDDLQQESANNKSVEDAVSADDNVTEQNVVKSDKTVLKVEQEASQKTGDSKGDSTAESATEVEANKNKTDLCADNSDNARDDFVAEKADAADKAMAKLKSDYTDETNSNCSSSSNLLQETQAISETGEGEEAEAENDNDEDEEAEADADDVEGGGDGDLELGEDVVALGEETKDSDEKETAPPAKRMRLSEDSANDVKAAETEESRSSCKSSDLLQTEEANMTKDLEVEEKKQKIEITVSIAVKRSHESLKKDDDEKIEEAVEEVVVKKSKTEESEEKLSEETTMMAKETSEEKVVKLEEERTVHKSEKQTADKIEESVTEVYSVPEIKAVPSNIPIPLYPPPKFGESVAPLSLDFFKRFRKTFDKMTKNDLEELVLQKVVEAIVHKSEFAEMRDIIEKQEKMIVSHRNKIAELSKQFRDLDMVHNRVVKDIELKNSQFPMPVKITRAVGLQVYIPNKRNSEPTVNATAYTTPTPPTSSVPRSPQRPASLPMAPAVARVPSSGDLRSNNSALASAAAAAAINSRRGCAQKVTPQRPVDGSVNNNTNNTTMLSTTQVAPGVYRSGSGSQSPLTQGTQLPPQNAHRVLNKGVAMQRNRFTGPTPSEQQRQQQQLQKLHLARQQAQTLNPRKLVPKTNQTSGHIITQQQQYRRPEGSTPGVDIHLSQQLPAGVSITPAKPKEKAVIDLTDEDDAGQAQAAAAAQMRTRLPTQPPNNVGSAASYMNNRTVPPLTRMPTPTQLPTKPHVSGRPQLDNMQTSKSNNNALLTHISTPPGTSITRVHITPANVATQRTKYGHPAPLPVTPLQSFNPAWKMPPPRPTIRISNLDNGIVISWTMEEAMDRHAECVSYQIYAYQETAGPPMVDSWRHVGDVKAMLLPMAVTLTQFQEGQRYYFAVRAVDVHQRFGPFSMPKTWT